MQDGDPSQLDRCCEGETEEQPKLGATEGRADDAGEHSTQALTKHQGLCKPWGEASGQAEGTSLPDARRCTCEGNASHSFCKAHPKRLGAGVEVAEQQTNQGQSRTDSSYVPPDSERDTGHHCATRQDQLREVDGKGVGHQTPEGPASSRKALAKEEAAVKAVSEA